jgi:hypothetical protein
MKGVAGGTLPATIWKAFMQQAGTPTAAGSGLTPNRQEQASPQETPASPEQSPALPPQEAQAVQQCNIPACEGIYQSFRASDCSYQPYSGGPRQYCER